MDTRLFAAFVEIARSRSFSRAAETLHLTQPAMSKRIAALESQMGAPLFDRIGRDVALTEAGRTLLPFAEHILRELDDGRRAISSLSGRVAGPLSIATSHHVGLHQLPGVLRGYTARYPDVELDLHFLESEEACREVAQGRIEMAVITLPLEELSRLRCQVLWEDPMRVVVASDHPLAEHRKQDVRDLHDHRAILPGAETFTRSLIRAQLAAAGVEPRARLETNYLETIRMLVSVGLGWSVLPLTMLEGGLVTLFDEQLQFMRRLGVVWHRQRRLSGAARALLELLEDPAVTAGYRD